MASDFVRNIKGVRNINKLSSNITTENDLISTIDGEVYVVTKKGYKNITNVETQDFEKLKTKVENLKNQSENNTTDIGTLKTDVSNNTTDIGTLQTDVSTNTTDIDGLQTDVSTNTTDIDGLQTDVSTNTTDIDGLQTDVSTNTTDIGTLKTDVSTNTTDIGTLKTDVSNNTSEIESLKNNKVLLYEGSASNTGDVMTLSQPYSDFTELKIKINRTGGNEIFIFDGEDDGTIPINHTNLFNSGSGYSVNEMLISRNSSTKLKIYYQGYYDSKGETTDSSGITILKIWGVK